MRWEALETSSRRNRRLPPLEDQVVEGETLRAALAELSSRDTAACLLLRIVHGFSAAEVGDIMGVSATVITKRLSRARQRLRAAYLGQNPPASQEQR